MASKTKQAPVEDVAEQKRRPLGERPTFPFSHEDDPIYLDYNATTPVDPAVVDAMLPYLSTHFGNPSNSYVYGRRAKEAFQRAVEQAKAALDVSETDTLLITSCSTEASNHAILGAVEVGRAQNRKHIITTEIEHIATLAACEAAERMYDASVTKLGVDESGFVDPAAVVAAIREDTCIISMIYANNEVGTLQDAIEISRLLREREAAGGHKVLFHLDASQAIGKVPVSFASLGCDLLSAAGHKFYAPKGVGALVLSQLVVEQRLVSNFMNGGGQQAGKRAGTEDVAYAVAFGAAIELADSYLNAGERERLHSLRSQLLESLSPLNDIEGINLRVNGPEDDNRRLPNTLSLSLEGLVASRLISAVNEKVCMTVTSACHGSGHCSYVLQAMGYDQQRIAGTVRMSVGKYTTEQEISTAAGIIMDATKTIVESDD